MSLAKGVGPAEIYIVRYQTVILSVRYVASQKMTINRERARFPEYSAISKVQKLVLGLTE